MILGIFLTELIVLYQAFRSPAQTRAQPAGEAYESAFGEFTEMDLRVAAHNANRRGRVSEVEQAQCSWVAGDELPGTEQSQGLPSKLNPLAPRKRWIVSAFETMARVHRRVSPVPD